MVALVALGAQIPGIVTLARLVGGYRWVLAGAALVTLPFIYSTLTNPFQHQIKSRARLVLTQWPFYVWWTVCLTHFLFAPLGLVVAALSPLSLSQALAGAGALSVIAGLAGLRRTPRIVAQRIAVVDLPPELDGYRIAQLSDVHCGPFTPPERVRRWVARANALERRSGRGHRRPHHLGRRLRRRGGAPRWAGCARATACFALHGQPRLLHRRRALGRRAGAATA